MGGGSCLSSEGLLSSRPPHPAEPKTSPKGIGFFLAYRRWSRATKTKHLGGVKDQCFALVWDTDTTCPEDIHCNLRAFVVQIRSCTEEFIQEEVADSPSSPLEKRVRAELSCQGQVTTAVEGD